MLPAVGGYWFLAHFNFTRFQTVRESGYHVLFRSAVVGIVFYLVAAGVVVTWRACCPPSIINFVDMHSPAPFTTEVILSLALASVLPYLFNMVYPSRKGVKRAARNAGEHVELLIIESVEEKIPVEITLRNRKIYIGLAGDTGVGGTPEADVAVVPMFSGYRNEDTQDLVITLGGVVKRVCSRSSLPGVGRWPSTTPFSWHNGSPLLEFQESVLHQVPQLVQSPVIVPLFPTVAFGRYHRVNSQSPDGVYDFIGVIGLVRQKALRFDTLNQRQSLGTVGNRTLGHCQPDRHPVRVHRQVQLAVQPPFVRAMPWLPPRAPALWGWALM